MRKMPFLRKLTIGLAVLVMACLFLQFFGSPRIKGLLYPGNHITLHINLQVNETPLSLSEMGIACLHEGEEEKVILSGESCKIKGGDYGLYTFLLTIPAGRINQGKNDIMVKLDYFNTNNWYIVNADCSVAISDTPQGYTGTFHIQTDYSDNSRFTFSKTVGIDEENTIAVRWGV